MLAAFSLPMMLAGCSSVPGKTPVDRNIPGPPSDCRSEPELSHKEGDDAKLALKKEREANRRASAKINRCRRAWQSMARRYKGQN